MQTPPPDEKTKVLPNVAPPPVSGATPPQAATPPATASGAAKPPVTPPTAAKPQSPLASLTPAATPESGPQKRRLIAGVVAAGSVLALGLLGMRGTEDSDTTADTAPTEPVDTADTTNAVKPAAAPPAARPIVIHTDRPVATTLVDDLKWEDAREIARSEIGPDGLFKWHGELHTTTSEEEFNNKTENEKADFIGNLAWHENHDTGSTVEVDGKQMDVVAPYLERVGEWTLFRHTDDDGDSKYYLGDAEGHGVPLENLSQDEYGNVVRTDPETGEVTPFTPTTILDNVADGKIDVQFFSSDVEVVDGVPTTEPVVATVFDPQAEYHDPYPEPEPAPSPEPEELTVDNGEPVSTSDLLAEKLHTLATAAGIDDIRKTKLDESGDGWDYKIKGEDGEKLKGHLSLADLQTEHHSTIPTTGENQEDLHDQHHPAPDITPDAQFAHIESPTDTEQVDEHFSGQVEPSPPDDVAYDNSDNSDAPKDDDTFATL